MCSPDLRGERRAVSSGKTLSSFVRSAVHVVDSLHARLPSLFDRRVFPTTPVFRFCLSFLFVHASSRARYALTREESFHLASDDTRFYRLSSISCLCFINVPRCRFVLVSLQHALFRLSSFIRFTPVSSTFSTFHHLASTIARPFLLHGPSLPLSFFLRLNPLSVSLQRHSLRRVFFLQPSFSASVYHPFHALPLSPFLSLAISHQLTHTLRRRQAPVPCGLVLRARGCCEIIVSPRSSRNQPPRVTPRRGKQQ